MKHIQLLIIALLAIFASCTNHGDIGPLYGQWVFTSVTVDGNAADFEPTDYSVRFENNIVQITQKLPGGDQLSGVGRWRMSGHDLTLDLTSSFGTGTIPPALKLPSAEINIDASVSGKKMTWTYASSDDKTIVYTLRKLI